MDTARERLTEALQDEAVTQIRQALGREKQRVMAGTRRRLVVLYATVWLLMAAYYALALGWSTADLKRSRCEYENACKTYATPNACATQFRALNRLDNTFALGKDWWWLMELVWPGVVVVVMCLGFKNLVSLTALLWSVWRLSGPGLGVYEHEQRSSPVAAHDAPSILHGVAHNERM